MDSSIEAGTELLGEGASSTRVGVRVAGEGPATELGTSIDDPDWEPRSSMGTPRQELLAVQATGLVASWLKKATARHRGTETETISAARAAQVLAALPSQRSRHRTL